MALSPLSLASSGHATQNPRGEGWPGTPPCTYIVYLVVYVLCVLWVHSSILGRLYVYYVDDGLIKDPGTPQATQSPKIQAVGEREAMVPMPGFYDLQNPWSPIMLPVDSDIVNIVLPFSVFTNF